MHRLLATAVFAYAGLSAIQWGHATRWLHALPGQLWRGNIVSDPFRLLASIVGPLAAACAAVLVACCIRARRWPYYTVTALFTFAVTSGCLIYEAHILGDYGLEVGRLWWLPWR